jgi:thioredoxin reductase
VVFTEGALAVSADKRAQLERAGVRLEERRIRSVVPGASGHVLAAVELEEGTRVPREFLFARPPQRQTGLVQSLGLALDEQGFVRVNEQKETSIPGIYAGGDLTTWIQGAVLAAAAGTFAASMLNHGLNLENAGAAHTG